MSNKHVMVDLETLGTTADSVILSIGAVKFDLEQGTIDDEAFYASISVESNLDYKRRVSEDTLIWWMKQSADAQKVFTEPKQGLYEVLEDFADWLPKDLKNTYMWSNGADFDLPMLAHAMTQTGVGVPWKFWNDRCLRTYKTLPGAKDINVVRDGLHHNALADAVHQAKVAQAIYTKLFGPKE